MSLVPRTLTPDESPRLLRGIDAEQIFSGGYLDSSYALNTLLLHKQAIVMTHDNEVGPGLNAAALTIAQLKARNPRIKVLGYVNTSYNYRTPAQANKPFSNDCYAKSARDQSKYLSDTGWATPLMDPLSADWLDYQTDVCDALLDKGFDGWFFDNTGHSPSGGEEINADGSGTGFGHQGCWHRVEDRNFGRPDNMHAWQVFIAKIHARLRTSSKRLLVSCNGLGSGDRYYLAPSGGPSSLLWEAADMVCAEGFMRNATTSPTSWPSEDHVKKTVDMLTDATARGKVVYALTKFWPAGVAPTQAQLDQWWRLVHGVFLLGADGYHGLQFSDLDAGTVYKGTAPHNPPQRTPTVHNAGQEWFSEYDVDLGAPLQNFTTRSSPSSTTTGIVTQRQTSGSGAFYRRYFTKGVVLVNPTASPTNAVTLNATYTRVSTRAALTGGSLTSIVVPARDAVILKKP